MYLTLDHNRFLLYPFELIIVFFRGIQVLEHCHASIFLTVHSSKKGEVQKCLVPIFKYVCYLLTR